MRYLPKMQQLRVFQELVSQGSIRSAARALSQSQPAISRTLKALEHALQTSLFQRGPAGITLTPSGELFAVRARLILAELQRAGEEIHRLQQQPARISVGMSALPGLLLLPTVLQKCNQQFPLVNLTVKEGMLCNLLPAVAAGEIDFAIGKIPVHFSDERLTVHPLFSVPLCVATRHNHPQQKITHLRQLTDEKWLCLEGENGMDNGLNQQLRGFFQQLPHPLLYTNSLLYAVQLAQKSGYVMIMPRPLLSEFSSSLLALDLPLQSTWHYGIVWSKFSPLTASARQILTLFIDTCRYYGKKYNNNTPCQSDTLAPS